MAGHSCWVLLVAAGAALASPTFPSGSSTPAKSERRLDPSPSPVQAALAHLGEEVRRSNDGSLAITNGNYHASFSKGAGVQFVPRLESKYQSQLSWQYRARAIETDTSRTPLDEVEPVVSPTGDHIVDFERPGIVERYEGERDGVEQIFVLTRRPDGEGDVRIRGEVTFAGERRRSGDALEFGAGNTSLTYGTPAAFDAGHRPLPVRAELQGDRLDLVVDGAALSGAQFPVTIDPLLGATTTFANGGWNGYGQSIDVAYNWDRAEFLVVFDTSVPPGIDNRDVRARRFHDNGDPIGPSYSLGGCGSDFGVNVAYDLHTNTYLVVWEDEVGDICARRLASDGTPLAEVFTVGQGSKYRPAIAARNFHEHTSSDPAFLVTWSENTRVRYSRVDAAGRVLSTGQANATALTKPAVTAVAYDPHHDRFLVVWNDTGTIRARAVAAEGSNSPEFVISSDPPATSKVSVAFDPSTRKYLVVAAGGGSYRGYFVSSAANPTMVGALGAIASSLSTEFAWHTVTAWPGGFVITYGRDGNGRVSNVRLRGNGDIVATTDVDWASAASSVTGLYDLAAANSQHGFLLNAHKAQSGIEWIVRVASWQRWTARYVHGGSGDFDGDGRSDLFVFRPASQQVQVRTRAGAHVYISPFDVPGGIPALLDWNGDGRADVTAWQPSNGTWRILVTGTGEIATPALGRGGDIPVPGDYLGLGRDQIAVFRPSTGTWYIRNPRGAVATTIAVQFGQVGDLPVPADWNGDGDVELGVWRPSTGVWYAAEVDGTSLRLDVGAYGQAGDTPLSGNFVGDSRADKAIYRRSNGRFYIRDGSTGESTSVEHFYGLPVPLDWDGDGRLDLVVCDPDVGSWYVFSPAENTAITGFGTTGDIPVGR